MKHTVYWLMEEMDRMKDQFVAATKESPPCWLVGVKEYIMIRAHHRSKMKDVELKKEGEILKFRDIPIFVKSSAGVEFGLHPVDADWMRAQMAMSSNNLKDKN